MGIRGVGFVMVIAALGACGKRGPNKRARCERLMGTSPVQIARCVRWTDAQLGCLERDDDSPTCEAAIAAMLGLQYSEVKATGPAPAWQVSLALPDGDEGQAGSIDAIHPGDGVVIATADDEVIAVADGAERWRVKVPGYPWAVAAGACVAVSADDGVRCFDPRSGALRWRTPVAPDGDPRWVRLAWRGDRLLMVGTYGEVAVADPAACTAGGACVVARPPLDGASVGWEPRGLALRPDGGWFHADERLVAVVGPDDVAIARFALGEDDDRVVTEPVVTPAGAALVAWGNAIHRIDPAACRGVDGLVPVSAAPPGCITTIADRGEERGEIESLRPLGEDGVAFVADNDLHIRRAGKEAWAASISYALTLLGGDPVLFTGGSEFGGLDLPPEVRAISIGDGATRWRTALPDLGSTGASGPMFTGDERWLYIASPTTIAALPRRATP